MYTANMKSVFKYEYISRNKCWEFLYQLKKSNYWMLYGEYKHSYFTDSVKIHSLLWSEENRFEANFCSVYYIPIKIDKRRDLCLILVSLICIVHSSITILLKFHKRISHLNSSCTKMSIRYVQTLVLNNNRENCLQIWSIFGMICV